MKFLVHAPIDGTAPPMGSSLTPSLTRTYAGWSSRGIIFGQPGTMAITIQDPAALHYNIVNLANIGTFYTGVAPNVIYPPIYYENDSPLNKTVKSVARFSDNQMPVPAGRAQNQVTYSAYRARHGGQFQIPQPQVVQKFRPGLGTIGG